MKRVHVVMAGIVVVLGLGAVVLGGLFVARDDGGARSARQVRATVERVLRDAGLRVCSRSAVRWNATAGAVGGGSWVVADGSCADGSDQDLVVAQAFSSTRDRDAALRSFESGPTRGRPDGQAWTDGDALVIVQGATSAAVAGRLRPALDRAGLG